MRALKDHVRVALAGGKQSLQTVIDRFLLQYRNATTGCTPAIRMRGHLLQSPIVALAQLGSDVWIRKHLDKNVLWEFAKIAGQVENCMLHVPTDSGHHRRVHIE